MDVSASDAMRTFTASLSTAGRPRVDFLALFVFDVINPDQEGLGIAIGMMDAYMRAAQARTRTVKCAQRAQDPNQATN
jgi:hypothetical protein